MPPPHVPNNRSREPKKLSLRLCPAYLLLERDCPGPGLGDLGLHLLDLLGIQRHRGRHGLLHLGGATLQHPTRQCKASERDKQVKMGQTCWSSLTA